MWRKYAAIICGLLTLSLLSTVQAAPASRQAGGKFETTAQSAVLMDGNGNVLWEKEAHKPLPPASVTKVMTLLLAVEAIEQGKVNLTDPVTISENAWKQGGSQIWLEPGEQMTVKELLTAVAVVSANDAAVALMEHIFGSKEAAVDAMNQRAGELGLKNSKFASVNGLPVPEHYMSAYDTALIAREAVTHPLYLEMVGIKEHWLRDGKNWLVNTNKLLWWYPGADGLKTGWTQEAKYCFVGTAKRDGLRLIGVVFATPEPRSHLRETMRLLDWGYANFTATPIVERGALVEKIKLTRGEAKEVNLLAKDDLIAVTPKGKNKNIQKKIIFTQGDILTAPVAEAEKYGEMIAFLDGNEVGKVDLIAAKTVPKAGFAYTFKELLSLCYSVSR
ncbi:MAG: D-alanyl-D-alanine carboxypeptidase family protein [Sporomusaceae bacterium]|nr:D-alanyl-D-alanine carboxypeptidase family protein [Sporomusaceae bacterium]